MIEIIGYVEVEETPVRWNEAGDMFMTDDFRWHVMPLLTDEEIATAVEQTTKDINRTLDRTVDRACEGCGRLIQPTGKAGRPAKRHPECR